jgi:flagella basal body P-ring formation protein FlgA
MKHRAPAFLFAALAWTTVPSAHADTATDVRAAAEQAVRARYGEAGSRVVITAQQMNSRLRLTACPHALQTQLPNLQGMTSRIAVAVSCHVDASWTIRVPVQLQVYRQVLVTTRPLARGDTVTAGDVHSEEREVTRLGYGFIENLDQISGRSLARPLSAGSVLEPGQLNGRQMVRAGDQVQLIAQLDGIEVRTSGLALNGGDKGSRLRVRNDNSGIIIDGVVLGVNEVQALP